MARDPVSASFALVHPLAEEIALPLGAVVDHLRLVRPVRDGVLPARQAGVAQRPRKLDAGAAFAAPADRAGQAVEGLKGDLDLLAGDEWLRNNDLAAAARHIAELDAVEGVAGAKRCAACDIVA